MYFFRVRSVGWLVVWLVNRLVGQSACLFGRSFCQLLDRLVGQMFVPLFGRSVDRVGQLVIWLVRQWVSRSVGSSVGWRVGFLVGGLVGHAIKWLVGLGGCLDNLKKKKPSPWPKLINDSMVIQPFMYSKQLPTKYRSFLHYTENEFWVFRNYVPDASHEQHHTLRKVILIFSL